MKKTLALILALVMICSFAVVPALAASGINANEQEVTDLLFNGVQVGSHRIYFLEGRQGEVYNFFNQDGIDMTDAEKNEIVGYINQAYALANDSRMIAWAEAGNNELNKLPFDIKQTMLDCGTKACAVMGLVFTYYIDGNRVTITDAQGHTLVDTSAVVKRTGNSTNYTAIILGAIAMLGVFSVAVVGMKKSVKVAA